MLLYKELVAKRSLLSTKEDVEMLAKFVVTIIYMLVTIAAIVLVAGVLAVFVHEKAPSAPRHEDVREPKVYIPAKPYWHAEI